jgi:hypothetical protein
MLFCFCQKFFWIDELFSYYLLSDPSFMHMMGAFHDKINSTPPLYFFLGWLWARIFGSTELSLRLFSSIGICIAFTVVWITLRQTYSFLSTSFGTLAVFCTSSIILSQNSEARMYGLFLAVCSLGLLQYDFLNRSLNKIQWHSLFINGCIHGAIVQTHLFGIFYSGAILFAQILRDRYFDIFKHRVYLSIILGWLPLIFYVPSFLNQADVGYPRSWISNPSVNDLISLLSPSFPLFLGFNVLLLIIWLGGLNFILVGKENFRGYKRSPQNHKAEISLVIFAYSFLAVPIFVWFLSRTIKPIFIDRYMIPTTISWSILLTYFSSRIIFLDHGKKYPNLKSSSFLFKEITRRTILLVAIVALLFNPLKISISTSKEQLPGFNDSKYGYENLPIVTQFSHDFVKRFFYSPQWDRYFFILDWEAALDNESGLFPPQEYKHLDALKRNYSKYFSNHIIQSENFLETHPRFLVLDYLNYHKKCSLERKPKNFHCPQWLEKRILSNSSYKVTELGEIDEDRKLLLVEKQ